MTTPQCAFPVQQAWISRRKETQARSLGPLDHLVPRLVVGKDVCQAGSPGGGFRFGVAEEHLVAVNLDFFDRVVDRDQKPDKLLVLSDAVDRLAADEPAASELVKLHLFGGLSVAEAAQVLGISRTKAYRQWTYARAWLRAELGDAR